MRAEAYLGCAEERGPTCLADYDDVRLKALGITNARDTDVVRPGDLDTIASMSCTEAAFAPISIEAQNLHLLNVRD